MVRSARSVLALVFFLGFTGLSAVQAQTPGEIQNLVFSDSATLSWDSEPAADFFNVYRGVPSVLAAGMPGECHATNLLTTSHASLDEPLEGGAFVYFVTGESNTGGEGTLGSSSASIPRPLLGGCTKSLPFHVQDRLGYGSSEWTRDRIATLGIAGYIAEQLDPASINEADNTPLQDALLAYEPPPSIIELIALHVSRSVYARRQLEQQMTMFWANHFNTYWPTVTQIFQFFYPDCAQSSSPACDPTYPVVAQGFSTGTQHRETEAFRDRSFNGNFREMLEESVTSPAMIIYLDGYLNKVLAPNENHAREVMELHAMGVDGGYTQTDVEEMARVMTGWNVCKKATADLGDPLAPCIANYWEPTPVGDWTATLIINDHDCGSKTLFSGTPQQVTFPGTATCTSPADAQAAVAELDAALDAIVAHPATPSFISKKILQLLVADEPTQSMVDALVLEWNDSSNPQGVGDLREVIRAALELDVFLDLAAAPAKIKTPLEHFVSGLRGLRGSTDGITQVLTSLILSQHLPFYNLVPTGYPEVGDDWIDTNNILERQNYGVLLIANNATANPAFGSDPFGLLADDGISTLPSNAAGIVEYFNDILFGGALTDTDKQFAINYLLTADDGTPDPNPAQNEFDLRILGAVGLMLGYAQFQIQ